MALHFEPYQPGEKKYRKREIRGTNNQTSHDNERGRGINLCLRVRNIVEEHLFCPSFLYRDGLKNFLR
jgi:hypothetical protein